MKLDDLRKAMDADPKALFATCDWAMVRPVLPVSDKWYGASQNPQTGKIDWQILQETDPWAKCGPAQRPVQKGVLVEVFAFDSEGKQQESQGKMLVRARDIGGTWGEFLTLHAEEVKIRGDKRAATIASKEWQDAAQKRLTAIGLTWPIGKVEGREQGDRGFYGLGLSSGASVRASEHYNYDSQVKRYKEIRPEGFKLERWDPKLSVDAGNAADVEYLFQVLEEGVKAVAKKQERAAKRAASKEARRG